jgi:hypothetical protein
MRALSRGFRAGQRCLALAALAAAVAGCRAVDARGGETPSEAGSAPSAPSAASAAGEALPRVLFLTHSAGYVHDVVWRPASGELAFAERALADAVRGRFELVASQDCGELARLDAWDAVLLFTTGELPVSDEVRAGLLDWVERGGALAGVHSAADTFHADPRFGALLGGEFEQHPWHQRVRIEVLEPSHPAVAHLGLAFEIEDEIYQFRAFDRARVTALLALDTDSVDASRGSRADGFYALAWCREAGAGRVFYTALGHGEPAWRDARFLELVVRGLEWTMARGPSTAPGR